MFLLCIILTAICFAMTIWVGMAGSILAAVFGVGTISMAVFTYFVWEAQQ